MKHALSPEARALLLRGVRRTLAGLILIGATVAAGTAVADPLDQLTGMESWGKADGVTATDEWKEWSRLRVQWRSARRDFRIQRRINQRLARLLTQPRGPSFTTVQHVLQR